MKRLKAREVHARCALHKRNGFLSCDPSNSEVRGWIKRCHRGFEEIDRQSIQDAFDSGAEVCYQSQYRLRIVAYMRHRNLVSK